MLSSQLYALAVVAGSVTAQMTTSTSSSATSAPTAVTGCHSHGDDEFFCIAGNEEWEVTSPELNAEDLPDSFEDCHSHGEELHCVGGDTEATLVPAGSESEHDHEHSETVSATSGSASTSRTATTSSTTTTGSSSATASSTSAAALPTAVTSCHTHGDTELFCLDGSDEWQVTSDWDQNNPPESFESCHAHGKELHCVGDDEDATLVKATESQGHTEGSGSSSATSSTGGASSSTTSSTSGASTSASDSDESSSAASKPLVMNGAGCLAAVLFVVHASMAI